MTSQDAYDLVVIGGGSAGLTATRTGARLGARVLLAERDRLGGDCLWTGCVPSKALLSAAGQVHTARTTRFWGRAAGGRVDFAAVMASVSRAIREIEPHDSAQALGKAGVDVAGAARFTGARTVQIDGRQIRFRFAVIATGSAPALPSIPGLVEAGPLTSDTVWDLTEPPERLVVLGGGAIGCELGQAFACLGSAVTIVEAEDRLLPREEPLTSQVIERSLRADGVTVLTGARCEEIRPGLLRTDIGTLPFDRLLVTTGRRAKTADLDPAAAGVDLDERGNVRTDARLRTSNRRIYAAGDVTGRSAFTHLAGSQGAAAAVDALLGVRRRIDYAAVPAVTFTDPEAARAGLTEAEARARHGSKARVQVLHHDRVDRAVTEQHTDGFTCLVIGPHGRIVGATVVAPRAGELIAHLAAAIRLGWTPSRYAATIHPYPTYGDGPWHAALAEVYERLSAPGSRRVVRALLAARGRLRA